MDLNRDRCSYRSLVGTVAAFTILAAYTACSSSEFTSTVPEDQGSYSASVVYDGDTVRLSGQAVFGTTETTEGVILNVVYLWTGDPDGNAYDVIWFQRRDLDLLVPGDYTIADVEGDDLPPASDFLALYAFADDVSFAGTFHSVTGILTIVDDADLELTGTFEVTGALALDQYHAGAVADTVEVSGTFRAVPGTIY